MQEMAAGMADTFGQLRAELAFALHHFLPPSSISPSLPHSPKVCGSHDLEPSDNAGSPPAGLLSTSLEALGSPGDPQVSQASQGPAPPGVQGSGASPGPELVSSMQKDPLGLPDVAPASGVSSTSDAAPEGERVHGEEGSPGKRGAPNEASAVRIWRQGNESREISEDSAFGWQYRAASGDSARGRGEEWGESARAGGDEGKEGKVCLATPSSHLVMVVSDRIDFGFFGNADKSEAMWLSSDILET
jgi:hypothetical protein